MIARSLAVLLFLAVTKIQGDDSACNFPPSVWCSSREIAERCQVTEQCMAWLDRGTQAPKVTVALYFETLCWGCQHFIKTQLAPTYEKIGGIIDLSFVVYGNARERKRGGKWEFDCQHGPDECLGNMMETCVQHLYNKSMSLAFIFCMEQAAGHMKDRLIKCATQCKVDQAMVLACANSSQGRQWEHEAAVKTGALHPPHRYVPWVVINGMHTRKMQTACEHDLLKVVCDAYTGEKPAACHAENTRGRCYKQERNFSVV